MLEIDNSGERGDSNDKLLDEIEEVASALMVSEDDELNGAAPDKKESRVFLQIPCQINSLSS